jgi:hypothetical protein
MSSPDSIEIKVSESSPSKKVTFNNENESSESSKTTNDSLGSNIGVKGGDIDDNSIKKNCKVYKEYSLAFRF